MDSNEIRQVRISNRRPKAGSAFALVTAVAAICLGVGASGAETARPARPGDIALKMTLDPKSGVITAGEPLLARVEITNQSDEDLTLLTGNSAGSTTYFEVRNSRDELVAATPRPQSRGLQGGPRLAASQVRTNVWIISALYEFQEPGNYTVRVQQLQPREGFPVLAEDVALVTVLPFDLAKLKARCDELSRPMRQKASYGDLDLSIRCKVLYAVRNVVVLPNLEWLAREWADAYAIRAMRRLGTDEALKLVSDLVAVEDRVGQAARRALQMPTETRDIVWDMGGY